MENGKVETDNTSALIFLGTGCSSAVPNAMCLIQPSDPPCPVCSQSLIIPPEHNPNYRCNTSLLIDYCQSNGEHSYILIDVGKKFREKYFDGSPSIKFHELILHLAQLMISAQLKYTSLRILWIVRKKLKEGQEIRRVAQLDWKIIEGHHEKPFVASGLQFVPLPVMHGEDYVSLGFAFGEKCKVAYISDISRFLPVTESVISKSGGGQLDLLILDTLYKTGSHNTHFCFPQTLDAVKQICPKRALLIGMSHEFDHHTDNAYLREWSRREGIPVQLAHDGLRIPVNL